MDNSLYFLIAGSKLNVVVLKYIKCLQMSENVLVLKCLKILFLE